jgi:hypothetical protein
MACHAILLAILPAACVQAAVMRGSSHATLAADGGERMRPDIVARTFSAVEDEWRSQVSLFLDCNASTPEGKGCRSQQMTAFSTTCAKVVDAIVSGSDGDRDNAREYMSDVCAQSSLSGWKQSSCKELALAVFDYGMNSNSYANRHMFKSKTTCAGFFSTFLDAEEKRKAQEAEEEAKARAEQEKKAAEEAAVAKKKAEEEAAVAKEKAEEEAKVEAAKLEKEHEQQAAEAKVKAAEAAERLAKKKAEAEQMQQEAQKKLEEAAKAEEEQKVALANHEKAQQLLNNASHAAGFSNASRTIVNNTDVPAPLSNATASNNTQLEAMKPETEQPKNASESLVVNATK